MYINRESKPGIWDAHQGTRAVWDCNKRQKALHHRMHTVDEIQQRETRAIWVIVELQHLHFIFTKQWYFSNRSNALKVVKIKVWECYKRRNFCLILYKMTHLHHIGKFDLNKWPQGCWVREKLVIVILCASLRSCPRFHPIYICAEQTENLFEKK